MLDSTIANFIYENVLSFHVADTQSLALVELCGPIMNLLRVADSNIPGTGKVYHENFKLGKILQCRLIHLNLISFSVLFALIFS
jgi:hypothetical protein